jgi:hypothetical protein
MDRRSWRSEINPRDNDEDEEEDVMMMMMPGISESGFVRVEGTRVAPDLAAEYRIRVALLGRWSRR